MVTPMKIDIKIMTPFSLMPTIIMVGSPGLLDIDTYRAGRVVGTIIGHMLFDALSLEIVIMFTAIDIVFQNKFVKGFGGSVTPPTN